MISYLLLIYVLCGVDPKVATELTIFRPNNVESDENLKTATQKKCVADFQKCSNISEDLFSGNAQEKIYTCLQKQFVLKQRTKITIKAK